MKHGYKKEKLKKSSLLYNVTTSEDKTKRNLNEGKFGLKSSFKKEKTKLLSTRRYKIYVSQIEKLISGIWLLKLKFRVLYRFILQFKKVLLVIKDLPEQMKVSYILYVFSSSDISGFNSNLFLCCVFHEKSYKYWTSLVSSNMCSLSSSK